MTIKSVNMTNYAEIQMVRLQENYKYVEIEFEKIPKASEISYKCSDYGTTYVRLEPCWKSSYVGILWESIVDCGVSPFLVTNWRKAWMPNVPMDVIPIV
jgi:hypothetical protein